jgi:sphingosine kinase
MKPLKKKGRLSVDGEIYPFKEFQVEVHQRLGTLLSCHGYYAADFSPYPPADDKPSENKDRNCSIAAICPWSTRTSQ